MLAVEVVVVPCFLGVCGFSRAALDTLGGTGTGTDTGTGAGPGTLNRIGPGKGGNQHRDRYVTNDTMHRC